MRTPEAKYRISAQNDTKQAFKEISEEFQKVSRMSMRVGAGIGVAVGAAVAAIGVAVNEAEEVNSRLRQTEALLRVTGQASGFTAEQINFMSRSIARDMGVASDEVRGAANIMLTFRSVSGETFREAIVLARDASSVFGNDLKSATVQLGKALEDPVAGVSALREVGVSFTAQQQEMIKSMVEAGDKANAQKLILGELRRQVGGAGAAQGEGLTGSTNRLMESWKELLVAFSDQSGAGDKAIAIIEQMARGADNIREKLFPDDTELSNILFTRLASLRDEFQKAFNEGGGRGRIELLRQEITETETQLKQVTERVRLQAGINSLKSQEAKIGKEVAQREAAAADAAARRKTEDEKAAKLRATQEAALIKSIEADARMEASQQAAAARSFEQLDLSLLSEEQRLEQSYWRRQAIIADAYDRGLASQQRANELSLAEDERYQAAAEALEQKRFQLRLDATAELFGNIATLMSSEQRKLFEIGKAAAIAETIVTTYSAANKQFDLYGRTPFAYAAAAAAVVAGLARVEAIRNTKFGGGGSGGVGNTGSGVSTAQNPVGPPVSATPQQGNGGGTTATIIVLVPPGMTDADLDTLMERQLQRVTSDDYQQVPVTSRNGQALVDAAVAKMTANGSRT